MFAPRAPLPERIGAFRVRKRLPSPTSVDVYLAHEEGPLGFQREVVLKVAPKDDALAEELAREATAVAQLNHPAIVRMFSFFEHEGRLVLVLERFEGTSLAKVLQATRRRKLKLPDASVFHVAHRLASALAHAHGEQGKTPVVHRGISPAAVVVAWDGTVRLAGFGLAKIVGRSPDTAVGLVKGVSGYMAPEQIRGERVTERTDIYQLGLLIFEMLSGEPPPGGPQESRQMELVHMMAGERLPSVANLRPKLPRELVAVFDGALEVDPQKRGITAKEIARWLEKTVDVDGGRQPLAERAVAVRSNTTREESEVPRPVPQSPTRRTVPRFPGVSTRVTGRVGVEDLPPSSRPMPPSKTAPPAARSAHPPRPQSPPMPAPPSVRPQPLAPLPAVALDDEAPPPMSARPGTMGPASSMRPGVVTTRPAPGPSTLIGMAPPPAMVPSVAPAPWGDPAGQSMRPTAGIPQAEQGFTTARPPARGALVVPLALGGALLVAGGALAVAFLALRRPSTDPPAPPAVAASAAPPQSSAAAPPVAPPPEAPPPPKPAEPTDEIPAKRAGVIVQSPVAGTVYLYSKPVGETETLFVIPCGRVFLRVGKPFEPARQTQWLTAGVSTILPCGATTKVEVPMTAPPVFKKKK